MANRKTTPAERKKFIEKQGVQRSYGSGHRVSLPRDMSSIDRKGNIVRPNKEDYEAAKRESYEARRDEAISTNKRYDALISKYGKDSEAVYEFERDELGMRRKRKASRLEGAFAIVGLIVGIFLLSSNITGNAIANINGDSSNLVGIALLAVGLVCSFFWFRSRNLNSK